MFDKPLLVRKVVNSLEKAGCDILQTNGSFDIVAKNRGKTMLVKVLMNVDALKEDQAMSLRTIAYFMGCQPVIIAVKNNRESLDDDVVYSRFDVPVMTPRLFEIFINEGDITAVQSAKGRHTVEINADVLREKRKEAGLTLEGLAEKVGITKKAAYEIESQRVNPTKGTVDKIERILSVDIQKPYEIKKAPLTYMKPKTPDQENISRELTRMGIDNSPVHSTQFENVGRGKFSIMTSISHNVDKIKKQAIALRKVSGVLSSKAVIVSKKSPKKEIHGVAVVLESELPQIQNPKELKKVIEEKE